MGIDTYITLAVILVIVGLAVAYVIKAKKSGKKCIGCPDGCSCSKSQPEAPSCGGNCAHCPGCASKSEESSN